MTTAGLLLAVALGATRGGSPSGPVGSGRRLECGTGAIVRLPLAGLDPRKPIEPFRLELTPVEVRIHLRSFKASRTKGRWVTIRDQRPIVVTNESSGEMSLADVCSEPKGPAAHIAFSVKGPYLGYSLWECKASRADAIELGVTCVAPQAQ